MFKGGRGGFAMKGRGKRKFFKCLEPSGVHGGGRKSKRSGHVRKETTSKDAGKSEPSVDGNPTFDDSFSSKGDFANNDRLPEKPRRSFSRAIKAILLETSLSRKFRRKGPCIPTVESKGEDHSSQIEKMKNLPLDDSKQCWGTEENTAGSRSSDMWDSSSSLLHSSLSFTTTTTLSSSRASSRSASDRKISDVAEEAVPTMTSAAKAPPPALKPPRPPTTVAAATKEPMVPRHTPTAPHCNLRIICFVILSLLALVFWGKVLAIVCTSIWLYLIPRSSSSPAYRLAWS